MVFGPISGAMDLATSAIAGAFTATTTRSCTPSSCGFALALTGAANTSLACCSRSPCACSASSVAPRATTLTSQPARASLTPSHPPIAPAP